MLWQFLDNNLMVILAFILANKAVSFLIAMSMLDRIQSERSVPRGSYARRDSHAEAKKQSPANYSSLWHIN